MGSKNLPAKMYKSGQRTEKTLRFVFANDDTTYISLAKALSEVNRTHYRNGLYYYISSVELQDDADGSTIDIETISDTWITKQAFIRAHQHWTKNNEKVDIPKSKYHDFKFRMTSSAASATLAVPENHGTADDWELSKYAFNNAAEGGAMGQAELYFVGPHSGSFPNISGYGIVKGYTATRRNIGDGNLSAEPVPDGATEDIMLLNDSDGHPTLADQLKSENDATPYDHDNFWGATSSDLTRHYRLATSTGAGRAVTMGGFCAPFGLLKITPDCSGSFSLTIKLTPGPYHGVYAERVYDDQ